MKINWIHPSKEDTRIKHGSQFKEFTITFSLFTIKFKAERSLDEKDVTKVQIEIQVFVLLLHAAVH